MKESYRTRFISHIETFLEEYGLLRRNGHYLLGLSAGVDSMVLLDVYSRLQKKWNLSLRAIHIDHGQRKESSAEAEFVKSRVAFYGHECLCFRSNEISPGMNEIRLREMRYNFFLKNKGSDEVVVLAHHLDDSFEWSMLKSLRSSDPDATLGIPVWNRPFLRPFMCVSKNQIKSYASREEISWCEDKSNADLTFDRNYLRAMINKNIRPKFKNFLNHYVHQQNQLATKLNKHLLKQEKFLIKKDSFGGTLLIFTNRGGDISGAREDLYREIKKLSQKNRGELASQISKIIRAWQSPGSKGPFILSGQVWVFLEDKIIYIASLAVLEARKSFEKKLLLKLREQKAEDSIRIEGIDQLTFPILIPDGKYPKNYIMKAIHPLFPHLSKILVKEKRGFQLPYNLDRKNQAYRNPPISVKIDLELD